MWFRAISSGKKKKIKRIYIKPPPPSFTTEEIILCSGCKKEFFLSEIKIHCDGCNKFFHCKIAGKCYGPNCSHYINGMKHNLSWCISCASHSKSELDNKEIICKKCKNETNIQ